MNEYMSYKFVDSEGNLRDKVIAPSRKVRVRATHLKSTWFDGSSFGFMPTNNSDLLLVPDPDSLHYDPIREMEGVFCFLHHPDDSPLETDFRTIARLAQEQDEQTEGALFGVEPEFFLLVSNDVGIPIPYGAKENWKPGKTEQYEYYGALPPIDNTYHIRHKIMDHLDQAGLEVESCHYEVAPGQAELSWKCDTLLRTADKMLLAKYLVQATAARFKDNNSRCVIATFDPKPFDGLNGSGCHVHQSIPAMVGSDEVLEIYAQGLVDNYDKLVAVCNTHKNSHKRLVPGFEAPTKENNGFGRCDRTKTVRIPAAGHRLEYRLPDPCMNPYIALPMMLKFGREAVKSKLGV